MQKTRRVQILVIHNERHLICRNEINAQQTDNKHITMTTLENVILVDGDPIDF